MLFEFQLDWSKFFSNAKSNVQNVFYRTCYAEATSKDFSVSGKFAKKFCQISTKCHLTIFYTYVELA